MIYIGLPFPVILEPDIKLVAKLLKEPEEDIRSIYKYSAYGVVQDGILLVMKEEEYQEKKKELRINWKYCMGSYGLIRIAKEKHVALPTVPCIYVPAYIWKTFKASEKNGLNYLMHRLENRIDRLHKVEELCAPEIIIRNERRMLEDCVNSLSDNTGKYYSPVTDPDDRRCCSFSEVDYSLRDYIWIDPYEEDENEKIVHITPPKYFNDNQVEELFSIIHEKEVDKLDALGKVASLEQEITDLKSLLAVEKDRNKRLKEERDETVRKLSKENLELDHRVDQLIKLHQARYKDM